MAETMSRAAVTGQAWPPLVPLGRPLVGVRHREHARFVEARADDLQPDRQTGLREPARDGDRRQAEDVERAGVARLERKRALRLGSLHAFLESPRLDLDRRAHA